MQYLNLDLDPFQQKAFAAVDRGESLIVAAPTGCGKTLIAEYAVEVSVRQGGRAVYTAPIKALSNQKYRDFRRRFGDETVGIQTGDVTINPAAHHDHRDSEPHTEVPRLVIYYAILTKSTILRSERARYGRASSLRRPGSVQCLSLRFLTSRARLWMRTYGAAFTVIEETFRPVPPPFLPESAL
jgi:hypothetical protein